MIFTVEEAGILRDKTVDNKLPMTINKITTSVD